MRNTSALYGRACRAGSPGGIRVQVPQAADYIDEEGVYRFDVLPWPLKDAGLERVVENSAGPSAGAWCIEGANPKNVRSGSRLRRGGCGGSLQALISVYAVMQLLARWWEIVSCPASKRGCCCLWLLLLFQSIAPLLCIGRSRGAVRLMHASQDWSTGSVEPEAACQVPASV